MRRLLGQADSRPSLPANRRDRDAARSVASGARSLPAIRSTDRRWSDSFFAKVENPAHGGGGRSFAKNLAGVCQQFHHPGVEKRLAASGTDICDNVHQGDVRSLPDTSLDLAGRIELSPASRACCESLRCHGFTRVRKSAVHGDTESGPREEGAANGQRAQRGGERARCPELKS